MTIEPKPVSRKRLYPWSEQAVNKDSSFPSLGRVDKDQDTLKIARYHCSSFRTVDALTDLKMFADWTFVFGSRIQDSTDDPKLVRYSLKDIHEVPETEESPKVQMKKAASAPCAIFSFSSTQRSGSQSSGPQKEEEDWVLVDEQDAYVDDPFICYSVVPVANTILESSPASDLLAIEDEIVNASRSSGKEKASSGEDFVVLGVAEEERPSLKENAEAQTAESKNTFAKAEDKRGSEKKSDPLESSDVLVSTSTVHPSCPSSVSPEEESTKENTSHTRPVLPPTVDDEQEGLVVKVFYGLQQQKVLEHTVLNGAMGCSVFFGERIKNIPEFEERMYGPSDAQQLEVPRSDVCVGMSPKEREFIDSILQAMSRGVVFTTQNGDVYARRLCRTRTFVYEQGKKSWPLSRETNTPEKIFDFGNFCRQFEKYKKVSNIQISALPDPYVYLTFGHRVPFVHNIRGQVLVAIAVKHRGAEQMLREFQSSQRL